MSDTTTKWGDLYRATLEREKTFAALRRELAEAQARIERLERTLNVIADFAVGNVDACEIIARRARAALDKPAAPQQVLPATEDHPAVYRAPDGRLVAGLHVGDKPGEEAKDARLPE